MAYDFQFLTEEEATPKDSEPDQCFLVRDVLDLADSGPRSWRSWSSGSLSGNRHKS